MSQCDIGVCDKTQPTFPLRLTLIYLCDYNSSCSKSNRTPLLPLKLILTSMLMHEDSSDAVKISLLKLKICRIESAGVLYNS
jgi:hypothetical protein